MIISFSVSNFRSFAGEETLNLVASGRYRESHANHLVPIPGTSEFVLRTAVIYGANGAGKSNLVQALSYLRTLVLRPRKQRSGGGRASFRFDESLASQPSTFDLRFLAGGKVFGFGVKVDDHRVCEEWLLEVDGNKERVIYERVTDSQTKVIIEKGVEKSSGEKLRALALIGGPPDQTFLATIRATLDPSEWGNTIGTVIDWFESHLKIVVPDANYRGLGTELSSDSEFCDFAGTFLKGASTGVDSLNVTRSEVAEEELRAMIPEKALERLLDEVQSRGLSVYRRQDQSEILVERGEQNRFYLITIGTNHEHVPGKVVSLDVRDESDGTRRLLNLIPALHHLRVDGGAYVIDEVDRSMHPLLVWKFLEFFLKACDGECRQLIVTTHESNLLDHELLRRDEIWFVEKENSGATRMYSLAEFNPRNDLKLEKHYLQGRFGAVPFLGSLDSLLPREEVPA